MCSRGVAILAQNSRVRVETPGLKIHHRGLKVSRHSKSITGTQHQVQPHSYSCAEHNSITKKRSPNSQPSVDLHGLHSEDKARADTSPNIKANVLGLSAVLTFIPSTALAAEEGGFNLEVLGKWAVILLLADVVSGLILGKNLFKILGNKDDASGESTDWKEKFADQIMEKMKEKEGSASPPLQTAKGALTKVPGYNTAYEILQSGSGEATVEAKDTVTVHATGIVKETGQKFWSTKDAGQKPFTFDAGVGAVITGWDQGCLGMQIGEIRRLDIPADEGYGASGFPAWGIPAHGGLLFEIEILSIQGK